MRIQSSPELPISVSYNHGAGVIEKFVAGVNSVMIPETVRFRVAGAQALESDGVTFLRKKYPTIDLTRFLTNEHGTRGDEAKVAFGMELSGGGESVPNLNLQLVFKSVAVGSVALEGLNANGALREGLSDRLVPSTFCLLSVLENQTTLLDGSFGSDAEQPADTNVKVVAAIIDIAATEMGKFDPAALDAAANRNRGLPPSAIPFGV